MAGRGHHRDDPEVAASSGPRRARRGPDDSEERSLISPDVSTEPQASPLAVELRGIVKQFPGVLANDQVDFDLRRGRGSRAARGERRRQEHPHEHPRGPLPGRRRGDPGGRRDPGLPLAARRHRGGPRHGPPALHAGRLADRHREHPHRPGRAALPHAPRPVRGSDRRAVGVVRDAASIRGPRSGSSPWGSSSGSRSSRCSTAACAS